MSQENVEVVRRILEAANRHDGAAALALYDPAVVWDQTLGPIRELMGGPNVYHGHDGLRKWFGEFYEAWADVQAEILELIDAGEQVISITNYRATGGASGADVEISAMGGLWTIREGKVVRAAWFRTREEALEAAGLSE
jgi:ketosteroid isomerase-like protein